MAGGWGSEDEEARSSVHSGTFFFLGRAYQEEVSFTKKMPILCPNGAVCTQSHIPNAVNSLQYMILLVHETAEQETHRFTFCAVTVLQYITYINVMVDR